MESIDAGGGALAGARRVGRSAAALDSRVKKTDLIVAQGHPLRM